MKIKHGFEFYFFDFFDKVPDFPLSLLFFKDLASSESCFKIFDFDYIDL